MASAQHVQLGLNLGADFPNRNIMPKMGVVKSIAAAGAYRPIDRFPLLLEVKGSLGMYSHQIIPQTYIFGNGDQTTVNVNYNSSMHKILFGTKFQIGNEYRMVNFFVTPQIGGAFLNSRIYIEDPNTQAGECKALESSHPHRSKAGVYGGEIGAQINLSHFRSGGFKHRINVSVNYLGGFKPVEYINVKYMKDETHGVAGSDPMNHDNSGRDLTATFINVTTNATHDHKIAELYQTPLQMWGFQIGYVILF
jgi:hypothetical protein